MSFQETSSGGWWRQMRMPLVLLAAMLLGGGLVAGIFLAVNGGSVTRPQPAEAMPTDNVAATAPAVLPAVDAAAAMPTAHGGDAAAGSLPNPHGGDPSAAPVQRITLADAKGHFDAGTAIFVDLRSGTEFAAGHIDKALSITSMDLEERLKEVPAETLVIAYGDNSEAGVSGAQIFRDIGFPNVAALDDGFAVWQQQGFPAATGAQPTK